MLSPLPVLPPVALLVHALTRTIPIPHASFAILSCSLSFSQARNAAQLDAVRGHMRKAGLDADVTTYTSLIDGYFRCSLIEKVRYSLDCAGGRWVFPGRPPCPYFPPALTHTHSLTHAHTHAQVWETWAEMEEAGIEPNVVTYTRLISVCGIQVLFHCTFLPFSFPWRFRFPAILVSRPFRVVTARNGFRVLPALFWCRWCCVCWCVVAVRSPIGG
jgi:pentacotripeptide repeat protein